VTIEVEGIDGSMLATGLRERWNIATRVALRGTSIRVSIAAFTDQRDLDLLIEGVFALDCDRSTGTNEG
jgi:hypothetical protein